MFDTEEFPKVLKTGGSTIGALGRAHNLEVLMHMIDPKRDPALCNKSEDALLVSNCLPEPFAKILQLPLLSQSVCVVFAVMCWCCEPDPC